MQLDHWQRRSPVLDSLDDIRPEIGRLDGASNEGTLNRAGKWSFDQCCQYLGRWVEFSRGRFPLEYPWRFRLMRRRVRLVSWSVPVSLVLRDLTGSSPVAIYGCDDPSNYAIIAANNMDQLGYKQ